MSDQAYESPWPSGSLEALPSSASATPTGTPMRSTPALAVGVELVVLIVTVSGGLKTVPSCTMSCTTYVPTRSAANEAADVLPPESAAVLPSGTAVKDQAYVSGSPSTSDDVV